MNREYKYKEKKIQMPGFSFEPDAIFPEKHSRVKGLIYEFRDRNWDDEWANRSDWVRFLAIMWKGTNTWYVIPADHPDYTWITSGLGWFRVLAGLEDEPTKRKFQVEEMKSEIKEYQESIRNLRSKIRELERLIRRNHDIGNQNKG